MKAKKRLGCGRNGDWDTLEPEVIGRQSGIVNLQDDSRVVYGGCQYLQETDRGDTRRNPTPSSALSRASREDPSGPCLYCHHPMKPEKHL